jgi:galactokinase
MGQAEVREAFQDRFGCEAEVYAVAPGRINLIGEHTDYNNGFVFPAAIDRQVWIAARVTEGPSQVVSLELGDGQPFHVGDLTAGSVEGWAAYAAGIAWALAQEGFSGLPNIEAVVKGEVPIGSGISSSAAIELAFGVAWNQLADLDLSFEELAKVGQTCENRYVGVSSGIMDQMASALGKEDHAMFLDTLTLQIRYAPLPHEIRIVVCDTQKPRALADSAYNQRRLECETAAKQMGVGSLREVRSDELESWANRLDDVIFRRARHVVTENERCLQFLQALEAGDLERLGLLMRASHESLRDDYEVTGPELDAMAESAWEAPGCIGARMTGAGFGGACVALAKSGSVDAFIEHVAGSYTRRSGREGEFIVCRAVNGAHVLDRI